MVTSRGTDATKAMRDAATQEAPGPNKDEPSKGEWCLGARYGSLAIHHEKDPPVAELIYQLREAFSADKRVIGKVEAPVADATWDRRPQMFGMNFPDEIDSELELQILRAKETWRGYALDRPFILHVHVPAAEQPRRRGARPSVDDYVVLWDLFEVLVFWQQDPSEEPSPIAGYVAIEVIVNASEAVGAHIHNQRCSRECGDEFGHAFMRLRPRGQGERATFRRDPERKLVCDVDIPSGATLDAVPRGLFNSISVQLKVFLEMKNVAQRIFDVEDRVRSNTMKVHDAQQEQAERAAGGWWQSVLELYRGAKDRRRMSLAASRVSLGLATVEGLHGRWLELRHTFVRMAREGPMALFEFDFDLDESAMNSLDFSHTQVVSQGTSGLLLARALVWATVAGAVTAAVVSGLFLVFTR